ncbi:CBS domain-containing protein [Niabella terrae]
MLIKDLLLEQLPQVKLSDTVDTVLQWMYHDQLQQLPVVLEGRYLGMITEAVLQEEDGAVLINELNARLSQVVLQEQEHFLKAVALAASTGFGVLAVTDTEGQYKGALMTGRLVQDLAGFLNLEEAGALVVLEMEPRQYSFSEISKIVETNDAQITQLNTSVNKETGMLQVTLKLNKLEVSDVIATFQRYEYHVKHYFGEELYANELRDNYENLINYLNI